MLQQACTRRAKRFALGASHTRPVHSGFLNLKDEYSESDLEDALLSHLMDFYAGAR